MESFFVQVTHMPEPMDILRHSIESAVYRDREQERIVPEDSKWLMDFRRVALRGDFLEAYTEEFYRRFEKNWPFQVGGAEVAAIPLVTAIVMKMREKGKPINGFFVRKSRKKSGLLKMVEGTITDTPIIFVDDLINFGRTFERLVLVAAEANQKVLAVFAILRFRPIEFYTAFRERSIRVESIFTLDDFREKLGTRMLSADTWLVAERFRTKWRFASGEALLEWVVPKSGLVFDNERLYFGSDRGTLFALDKRIGEIAWRFDLWPKPKFKRARAGRQIFSTPVIYGGRVYFGAFDGNVYCLDAASGKRRWVSFDADWVEGSPLVLPERGMLIVPAIFGLWHRLGAVMALDLSTGKKRWQLSFSGRPGGSPVYALRHGLVIIASQDGTVYALRPTRDLGEMVWSFKAMGCVPQAPVLDADENRVIFASLDGNVYALDAATGNLKWRFENGTGNYATPLIHEQRVFVASLDKNAYCLDLATGERIWTHPMRARLFASPRMYDNHLYLGGNDARLVELDPASGRETGYFQVTERITNPLFHDPATGLFYLLTYANEVYCLGRKREEKEGEG